VELGLALPATTSTQGQLSVQDGWERYLAHCGRADVLGGASPRTLKRYQAVRDKHVSFCARQGIQSWQEIDKRSAENYGGFLTRQKYAPRSVYLELTLIKSVQGWLINEGLLAASHRFALRLRKPEGTDTYCYSQAEVTAMVQHCRGTADLHWLADVIVALACTGLRISELAALRWTDLDAGCNTIRLTDERSSSRRQELGDVRTTKGRRDRVLPIHPDLRRVLLGLPKQPDGRIFHGPRGGRLKPDTVRNVLTRDVIEPLTERFPAPPGDIGFAHGRVHSLRHFFCSQAFLSGAAEADIKEWLGHRDSKMVAHYRHLRSEDSQRRMQQIEFLGPVDRTVR